MLNCVIQMDGNCISNLNAYIFILNLNIFESVGYFTSLIES